MNEENAIAVELAGMLESQLQIIYYKVLGIISGPLKGDYAGPIEAAITKQAERIDYLEGELETARAAAKDEALFSDESVKALLDTMKDARQDQQRIFYLEAALRWLRDGPGSSGLWADGERAQIAADALAGRWKEERC